MMLLHGRGGGRGDRQLGVVGRGVVVGRHGRRYCRRSWVLSVSWSVVVVVVVSRGAVVGRDGRRYRRRS